MCSDMVTYMFYVFGHGYIYVLCVRTCLHICFMCSDMLTYMFYVFGHGYMYVLCVRTCLHICFMCSDMLTYMFYVFGHAYMYVLCVRTCLHICFMLGHAYMYVLCVRTCLHICFMCSDMVILLSKVIPRSFPLLTSSINLFSILIFALLFLEIFDGSIIINWHLSSFSNIPLFLNHVSKISKMSDSSLVMILCIQMSATDNELSSA